QRSRCPGNYGAAIGDAYASLRCDVAAVESQIREIVDRIQRTPPMQAIGIGLNFQARRYNDLIKEIVSVHVNLHASRQLRIRKVNDGGGGYVVEDRGPERNRLPKPGNVGYSRGLQVIPVRTEIGREREDALRGSRRADCYIIRLQEIRPAQDGHLHHLRRSRWRPILGLE